MLDGADVDLMFPCVDAEIVIGTFCAGHAVSISRASAKGARLEKLENLDEIWALCFRKPPPGWRFFGRFVEKDVLAVTHGYDRHELGRLANYSALAQAAIDHWDTEIGIDVVRSDDLHDYVSSVVIDLDTEDE
jgi:hypothetical protein